MINAEIFLIIFSYPFRYALPTDGFSEGRKRPQEILPNMHIDYNTCIITYLFINFYSNYEFLKKIKKLKFLLT